MPKPVEEPFLINRPRK